MPAGAGRQAPAMSSETRLRFAMASAERLLITKSLARCDPLVVRESTSGRDLAPSGNELVQLQFADLFDEAVDVEDAKGGEGGSDRGLGLVAGAPAALRP